MKNEKYFDLNREIKTIKSMQSNPIVTIGGSSTAANAIAASSTVFAATLVSNGSANSISAYDYLGVSTGVSITGLFQQISSFFFGRADGQIPLSNNVSESTTTARAIFINRPTLDEGIKSGSITASFSNGGTANTVSITAYDVPLTASVNELKLGRIGSLVISGSTADKIGTVFYDYGLVILHGSRGSATSAMFTTSTGANARFGWGRALSSDITSVSSVTSRVNINSFAFQTNKYIVRNLYFCRVYNDEFNYPSNPTSKKSNGELIDTFLEAPSVFITTIGLYDNADNCLAVGKISPAVRKNVGKEHTFILQIDF